jgi:hypothetical protein
MGQHRGDKLPQRHLTFENFDIREIRTLEESFQIGEFRNEMCSFHLFVV